MTISIPDIKKKILAQFDKTVKAATTRAIPIVKKEAIKQFKNTSTNPDMLVKFVASAVLVAVVLFPEEIKSSAKMIPSAQTIIDIETLNLVVELAYQKGD